MLYKLSSIVTSPIITIFITILYISLLLSSVEARPASSSSTSSSSSSSLLSSANSGNRSKMSNVGTNKNNNNYSGAITHTISNPSLFSVTTTDGSGAAYPRANYLSNGQILGVYTHFPRNGQQILTLVTSDDEGDTWRLTGTAAQKLRSAGSLDNGYLLQLPSGRVLLAYRNHDQDAAGNPTVYRITISRSDDLGATWKFHCDAVVVIAKTASGANNGVWEPFLRNAADGTLQMYYSHERSATDQDSVMLTSRDGGVTWEQEQSISGASEQHSRDGMVGIAELGQGSLLAIFETNNNSGPFFLQTVSSNDDGKTWGKRQTLYTPPTGKNAGAPQIARVGDCLAVSFMTNEDTTPSETAASWIDYADAKLLTSNDNGVTWSKSTIVNQPAFWPGLLVLKDNQNILYLAGSSGQLQSRKITM